MSFEKCIEAKEEKEKKKQKQKISHSGNFIALWSNELNNVGNKEFIQNENRIGIQS
jgi:hypothetical protein